MGSPFRQRIKAVLPHGLVLASQARRRYAQRWPDVPRDAATRELIAQSSLELVPATIDLAAAVALDVGANVGEWTRALKLVAPGARVIAIEPQPAVAETLRRRVGQLADVSVHQVAAGASAGSARLKLTGNSHLASLRAPAPAIVSAYEQRDWWRSAGEIDVETATIDDLVGDVARVSVLKLDVQGFEREALQGAARTLGRTDAVLIEVNFASYYEGEATFGELDALLRDAGFALHAIGPAGRLADGRLAWADACYVRPVAVDS